MFRVCVVVLGDVGRSPRMQYHALSLANEGYNVSVIGYNGTDPLQSLAQHKNVKFQYVIKCPDFTKYFSRNVAYVAKTIWQSLTLLLALILAGLPDFILVQNPPAIPSLGVCYVFSRVVHAKFIIDWHNYAYTILSLTMGEKRRIVRICQWYEFFFGRRSDANICVTRAMKDDLLKNHNITAVTLYDRPPEHFKPISEKEKHELLRSLGIEHAELLRNSTSKETVFTRMDRAGAVTMRDDRPGLVISSTSWTMDEDFSVLLEALQDYEEARKEGTLPLPDLVVAITGKGPLKGFYTAIMAKRAWKHIEVITPWLSAEDYPKFLACGDLGVCLHTSSSDLDLPMKVVDMFGCGLPVAAFKFKCLDELVIHQKTGLMFDDSEELGSQLQQWFSGFPDKPKAPWRAHIPRNLNNFRSLRWHENWLLGVQPTLQSLGG